MIYLKEFDSHASYEEKLNGGWVDFKIPNVSYCKDANDVHFNPYNLIEFYVGETTGTTPQTVSIYTDKTNHVDVTVSDGNKWYSYVLQKDKGLCKIEGDSVKNVVIKANISYEPIFSPPFYYDSIIPTSTVEASFKGSKLNITDIKGMFQSCRNLTSLDVSSFDTSNVTDMGYMFQSCRNLTSLDLSGWDTSNVTDMGSMFNGCSGLTSLDVSNFNTSNVTDMNEMFYGCSGLTSLDVSNFDTSKVTNMRYTFGKCTHLTSLTLSNFNTSNVTDMYGMFSSCSGLTSLNLSNFKTSNVTNMGTMFENCSRLTTLTLSGWVIGDATIMNFMFYGCTNLNTITMIGCSQDTIDKIKAQLTTDGIINNVTIVTE